MKTLKIVLLSATVVLASSCNWTSLVSRSAADEPGNDESETPAISGDGRYVAFYSTADNLVPGDFNGFGDIFVRDTRNNTLERINVDSTGNEAIQDSEGRPSISSDGRYVAFSSLAWNLVGNDWTPLWDIFVHDRDIGITTRVSVNSAGDAGDDNSYAPSISADGRFVAFQSKATNFSTVDNSSVSDIFVHDRDTGNTSLVSVDSAGNWILGQNWKPAISGDGRYVAFESSDNDAAPGCEDSGWVVLVHDRNTGSTTCVSVDSAGNGGNIHSQKPSISASGRFVAFESTSTNLVVGDTNNSRDVFLHDRDSGTTTRLSVDSQGNEAGCCSRNAAISGDGRYVAFESSARNLGNNNSTHVYVHDNVTGTTYTASKGAEGEQADHHSFHPAISANGRYLAFESVADNLVTGYNLPAHTDIFIRANQEVTVTSITPNLLPIGSTTAITITGTNFLDDAVVLLAAQITGLVIVDENTITLDATVPITTPPGAGNLSVNLFGTGASLIAGSSALCTGCITFFSSDLAAFSGAGAGQLCTDGLYSNGVEALHPLHGCVPGVMPLLDDGNSLTNDYFDEVGGRVAHEHINSGEVTYESFGPADFDLTDLDIPDGQTASLGEDLTLDFGFPSSNIAMLLDLDYVPNDGGIGATEYDGFTADILLDDLHMDVLSTALVAQGISAIGTYTVTGILIDTSTHTSHDNSGVPYTALAASQFFTFDLTIY